jgi:single-strand DNA-binding protein
MNHWTGFGNVGKKPDIKILESGKKVAKFSFATNKSYTNSTGERVTETQWHNILMWNKLADLCEKYVDKGSSLIIEGEISYRSYENKDGQTVYITEINGDRLHFAGGKKDETPQAKEEYQKTGKVPVKSISDINELPGNINDGSVPDDNDLPY